MGLRALLLTLAIQLAVLLVPIAAGLAGAIPGPAAGFVSIVGWFVVGVPASYAVLDAPAARRQRTQRRARPTAPPARSHVSAGTVR